MSLPTPARVLALTKKAVSEDDIVAAATTLELRTGVIVGQEGALGLRDQHFLSNAIAYQAAWLVDRPDSFDRDDVDSTSQDGQSAAYKAWAHTLAPNAKLALRRLSWRGTRSTTAALGVEAEADETDRLGRPLKWEALKR